MNKSLITTSWDDGSIHDLRLASLLKKYSVPATFYIPLSHPNHEVIKEKEILALSKDFEIGGHTVYHNNLTKMPLKQAQKEILQGKQKLEAIIGREITSFSYPYGAVNQTVKQLVGFAGFRLARTVSLFGTEVADKLLLPTTIHAYDHNPPVYIRHGLEKKLFYKLAYKPKAFADWEKQAYEALQICIKKGGIFHLWGHSWEIEERSDWERLERVLSFVATKVPEKNRVTNGELLSHFEKLKTDYYDSVSEKINDSYMSFYYQKEKEFLNTLIKGYDRSGKTVLDIGCGTGRLSTLFSRASYTGLDSSKALINFAKKNYHAKNIAFKVLSYALLKKETFGRQNLIIIWGVFEDETDPFGKLRGLPFVKSGTKIIFSLHNHDNMFFRLGNALKNIIIGQKFPYTSFSYNEILAQAKLFSKNYGYKFKIESFGVIPPITRFSLGLSGGRRGATLIVVLDKK